MREICGTCSMPKDLCVCNEVIEKQRSPKLFVTKTQKPKIRTRNPKTILSGLNPSHTKEVMKELRKRFHCNGMCTKGQIILHGDHVREVRQLIHTSPSLFLFLINI